tara:strand:- start:3680 stop:4540 length:861 start_codon:yes stop_codon:yes gene_type:complete
MHISQLIPDIYDRITSNKKVSKDNLDAFLEGIRSAVIKQMEEKRGDSGEKSLRMSSIGKPDRKIWMEINGPKIEKSYTGPTLIKFLYGSIIEELVIFLAKESGHEVDNLQKKIKVNSIVGHIDCTIDDEIVDIKSASDFAFRKFKSGSIESDDPFGYIGQISGYVEGEGKDVGYLLALNKVTGDMCLLEIDEFTLINAGERIKKLKKIISSDIVPDFCYESVPDGKSGNMKLSRDCGYCSYKWTCFPNMRVFRYSDSVKYLTEVTKEPQVNEITHEVKQRNGIFTT